MPPREVTFVQDHYYHIYNRGVARQSIFRETDNYLFFLRRLKKCAHDLNVSVIAYCLLPNHYHLLVRQDGFEPAGLLPQRCCNSYAKAFNKRYGRTGALFEDRYQAIEVDSEAYLLQVCRYIHANPVRHGLASQLGEWPFSNYPEWLGLRNGELVDRAFIQAHFQTAAQYGHFVSSYALGQDDLPIELTGYLRSLGG